MKLMNPLRTPTRRRALLLSSLTPPVFRLCGIMLAALVAPAGSVTTKVFAADWPAWRGPLGTGISTEKDLPLDGRTTQEVRWRTPLPEPGNSTPIVSKGKVFLTQSEGTLRSLLCFDRKDGKLLWKTGVTVEVAERTHKTNPYASASPVSDGERVIVWFGSGGLAAYDFSGNELWRTDLGTHDHRFGYGGSPVIQGDLCFLNFGPGVREFLVALDKKSGKEVWRHASPVPGADDIYGTWSTPLIVEHQGRVELISALRGELAALDPKTGKMFWSVNDWGIQAKASPVSADGVVVLSGDHDPKTSEVAVRLGGAGDISKTHVLWRKTPSRVRVGTGVIQNGYFYGSRTGGFADCIELESGKIVWDERLPVKGGNSVIWTSPVLADGKLYFVNQGGDIFVVRAGPQFELVAAHTLGETCNASPTISAGEIFFRTHQALWCFGGIP